MKYVLLALAFFLGVFPEFLFAEDLSPNRRKASFRLISPEDESQETQVKCAQWSNKQWYVFSRDNKVDVSTEREEAPGLLKVEDLPFAVPNDPALESDDQKKTVLPVEDGFLISFYAGEFGGSLWWFSEDGTQKKTVLDYDPQRIYPTSFVNNFLVMGDSVYALVGLEHLSLDMGGIIGLQKDFYGNWTVGSFFDLGSAAGSYYRIGYKKYFILTNKKVVEFSPLKGTKTLYEVNTLNRNGSHPFKSDATLARDEDGNIYIGGNYKIIRLSPVQGGYKEEWLIPEYCEWDVAANGVCRCRGDEQALGTELLRILNK